MSPSHRRTSPFARATASATLLAFVATSCGGKGNTSSPSQLGSASPISDQVYVQLADAPDGLDLRVSEGRSGPPAFDRTKLAPAKKLSDADAQVLLRRAAPIT